MSCAVCDASPSSGIRLLMENNCFLLNEIFSLVESQDVEFAVEATVYFYCLNLFLKVQHSNLFDHLDIIKLHCWNLSSAFLTSCTDWRSVCGLPRACFHFTAISTSKPPCRNLFHPSLFFPLHYSHVSTSPPNYRCSCWVDVG